MNLPTDPPSNYVSPNVTRQLDWVDMDVNSYPQYQPYQSNKFNSGLSLLSGLLQSLFSFGSALANRAYQEKQQSAEQRYMSPKEQMQRFREAGINPYLALGNVSSGSFGSSPSSLPDVGAVLGNSIESGLNAVSQISQLQNQVLQNDMMKERIEQLRLSNYYNRLSVTDRLRLITANLSSLEKVNMLKDFDIQFQRWMNDPTIGSIISHVWDEDNKKWNPWNIDLNGLTPNEYQAASGLVRSDLTNDKIYQDYVNSIQRTRYLDTMVNGMLLGNSRSQIAYDYERRTGLPWSSANSSPLDKILGIILNKVVEKYGDKFNEWLKNL